MKARILLLIGLFFLFSGIAQADLYDRGGGLIYDSNLNITWLQDANYAMTSGYNSDGLMTWSNAVAWADQLVYGGYQDWRLPKTLDGLHQWDSNGTTTAGYNITSSEMGYMFYENLGNLGYEDRSGNYVGDGNWGLINRGLFNNLQPQVHLYWSGTEYGANPAYAWYFYFGYGIQNYYPKESMTMYAWAVRDGDVTQSSTVPVPAAVWLLGSGLLGLAGIKRRIKS